jgi:hypothetical protein
MVKLTEVIKQLADVYVGKHYLYNIIENITEYSRIGPLLHIYDIISEYPTINIQLPYNIDLVEVISELSTIFIRPPISLIETITELSNIIRKFPYNVSLFEEMFEYPNIIITPVPYIGLIETISEYVNVVRIIQYHTDIFEAIFEFPQIVVRPIPSTSIYETISELAKLLLIPAPNKWAIDVYESIFESVDKSIIPAPIPWTGLYTLDFDGTDLYTCMFTGPIPIIKCTVAPSFAQGPTLNLDSDLYDTEIARIDSGKLYTSTYFNTPAVAVKVDLGTFTQEARADFIAGEDEIVSCCVVPPYVYFGTLPDSVGQPGKIVRFTISPFARVDAITLASTEGQVASLVSDGTYLYAGCIASSYVGGGYVVRISLSSFARVDHIALSSSENFPSGNGMVIIGTDLYVLITYLLNRIIKIDLTTFTRGINNTLPTSCTALIAYGSHLITAQWNPFGSSCNVYEFASSTLVLENTCPLTDDELSVREFAIVGTDLYCGIGDVTNAKIVKLDLNTFTRTGALALYQ